jgi:hypothetical protein
MDGAGHGQGRSAATRPTGTAGTAAALALAQEPSQRLGDPLAGPFYADISLNLLYWLVGRDG